MKRLLVFVLIALSFIGQTSRVEANEGGKSHLQMANEDIEEIDRIAKISNPDRQAQAISDFMKRMQGFNDSARVEAAKNNLNKYTWNITGNNWAVVYESKNRTNAVAGGYIMTGDGPPQDAQILPTKTIRGVKR